MKRTTIALAFLSAVFSSSCGFLGGGDTKDDPEDATIGLVNKVDALTANVITVCGASYSVSSSKETEVSVGIKDVLKSPAQGDAKLALSRNKVAEWKASNPDNTLYYDCVEKQTVHAITRLEAENAQLKDELWISNVAVIEMNSYFGDWKRKIGSGERWKQYNVDKVEIVLSDLKKNRLSA